MSEAVYATPGYEASVANLAALTLETDNVFGDDGGASQLGTVTGNVTDGYHVVLAVGVDTTTESTAGNMPGGMPPGGGGMPPGGMPPGGMPPGGTPPSGMPGPPPN